jgi:DNA-binding GntR family transcriptional regulator
MQEHKVSQKIQSQARSVRDIIYEALKEGILSGQYPSGFHLRERELAASFEISTTPVKEALRRLEQEGLVVTQARKGVFVSSDVMRSIEEITWARSALEGVAARLAAMKGTSTQIESVHDILKQMKEATQQGNKALLVKLNTQFHQHIRRMSQNQYITQQIEALLSFDAYVREKALKSTEEMNRALNEHTDIFEAIKAGQADRAEAYMIQHIRRTNEFVSKQG